METLICTVKHDTFDAEGAFRPRGTQIPGGKVLFGPRVYTKHQRGSWVFRQFNQPREIITTYILVLIISAVGWDCQKYHVARWVFAWALVPFGVFPSEFPTLSRN